MEVRNRYKAVELPMAEEGNPVWIVPAMVEAVFGSGDGKLSEVCTVSDHYAIQLPPKEVLERLGL